MVNPALKKQIQTLFAHPGSMKINEIRESFREGLFKKHRGARRFQHFNVRKPPRVHPFEVGGVYPDGNRLTIS